MMAAEGGITLYNVNYVRNTVRYYFLSNSGNPPTAPANGAQLGNGWTKTEPSFSPDSAGVLYFIDQITTSKNEIIYSEISKSSTYEAAKKAWEKANASLNDAKNYTDDTVNNLKIGGRNYVKYGKGSVRKGFFAKFATVNDEYGEVTLRSKKTYSAVDLSLGFVLGSRDYIVGEKMTWSYDIMYTEWNFPEGTKRTEWWMGQRYTQPPTGETGTGNWTQTTGHALPVVGVNGCELNKWYHVERTITIPKQASSNVGVDKGRISLYNSSADAEASVTLRMKNVKLEYGSKATDFTPSPEDTDSDIETSLADAKTYSKNAVDWVSTNGSKTSNLYSMVSKWTEGAISDSTQIIGGWIKSNTITAKQLAIGDFNNYCRLNENTASFYNFDVIQDESGAWYKVKDGNMRRDIPLSEKYPCQGGESFLVEFDISTSIKGSTSLNDSSISTYLESSIGIFSSKQLTGNNFSYLYATRTLGSSTADITHVSCVVKIPDTARYFQIYLQTNGYPTFSGTLKIRNILVRKCMSGQMIVDGTIKGIRLEGVEGDFTGQITAKTGYIGKYKITDTYLITGNGDTCTGIGGDQAFWAGSQSSNTAPFRVTYDGTLVATNATITGTINASSGTIAGWTINEGSFYNGINGNFAGIGKYGTTYAFWAGASSSTTGSSAPFRVGHNGTLVASNATITGKVNATSGTIADWSIVGKSIYSAKAGISCEQSDANNSTSVDRYAFWAGEDNDKKGEIGETDAKFRVTQSGEIEQWGSNNTYTYIKSGQITCSGTGEPSKTVINRGNVRFYAKEYSSNYMVSVGIITDSSGTTTATGILPSENTDTAARQLNANVGLPNREWTNVYTKNVYSSGIAHLDGQVWFNGVANAKYQEVQTYAANMYIGSSGRIWKRENSSSKQIKHSIRPLIKKSIRSSNLLDVDVVQYKYNDDVIAHDDQRYDMDMPGFVIEDLNKKYPICVDKHGKDPKKWSWNAQFLIPPMLDLIQKQEKRIQSLERLVKEKNNNDT